MATDDKVIERIQKLLALAHSPNEHEAAQAAARATELLTKHQLSLDDLHADEVVHLDLLLDGTKWRAWLLAMLSDIHGARLILTKHFEAGRIVGQPVALEGIKALYETLQPLMAHYAEVGWAEYVEDNTDFYGVYPALLEPEAEPEWKESFLFGMLARLEPRMRAARESAMQSPTDEAVEPHEDTEAPSTGLVRLEHQLAVVDAHIAERYEVNNLDAEASAPEFRSTEGLRRGLATGDRLPLTTQRRVTSR